MPKKTTQLLRPAMPVRFHPDVFEMIKDASQKTRLSYADTVRISTEKGLPLLLEALGVKPAKSPARKAA